MPSSAINIMCKSSAIILLLMGSFSLSANKLQTAILAGDEQLVKELIDNHGFKDEINEYLPYDTNTPLYTALAKGHLSIAKLLIESGANIDAKNGYEEETILHYALRKKQADIIKFLLSNKANPNIKNKSGKTPLHLAAINNDLEAAQSLIQAGARGNIHDGVKPDWEYLFSSSTAVKYPLDYVVDKESALYQLLLENRFPLHYAVIRHDRNELEKLLATGVYEADEENSDGHTALFLALSPFDIESAWLLVQNGANANKISLIKKALENNDLNALKFLVDNKAEIGAPLLHQALKERKNQIAKYLILQGVPLNLPDDSGDTPLHLATKNEELKIDTGFEKNF